MNGAAVARRTGVALTLLTSIGVALWLRGGRVATHEVEIVLPAGPDEVFQWLVEPARLCRWIGGLVESRPLGDGVLAVGARSVEVVEEHGRRMELTSVVAELDRPHRLAVRLSGPPLDVESRYRLEAVPQGTHLQQRMTARYKGWVRLFAPFLRGSVQRKLQADVERLRAALEARA